MRRLTLEALTGSVHPNATFHDSELEALHLNFVAGSASLSFRIPIGVAGHELTYERGELVLAGLLFFAVGQPNESGQPWAQTPLWITSDGPLPDPEVQVGVSLPTNLPDNAFCHYFFSSNTNSFIVLAASEARFTWNAV